MKKFLLLQVYLLLLINICTVAGQTHPTLAIGSKAPDFNLPGVDGKNYSLASFKDAKVLAIIFMCDHCPTSQAYEKKIIKLTHDYTSKGVDVVAINPNNPEALRLDELGWSDVGDDMNGMKIRAKECHFNFPYLYDGETQATAQKYGPVSTPHVFIFDQKRILRYAGRFDDMENPAKTPTSNDARDAIDAVLNNTPIARPVTKVFGCSIKWIEKSNWINKAKEEWAKAPVTLDTVNLEGVKELLKNKSDKLRLINVWATWCGPCVEEFPEFIKLSHIYKERDFEFISISLDIPGKKEQALNFLKSKQSSGANYIFNGDSKYAFIDAVDTAWQGALPYTLLVEPGGKIVYSHQGEIDPEKLRLTIFNDKYIGRLYKD